jgi:hypothetical protein
MAPLCKHSIVNAKWRLNLCKSPPIASAPIFMHSHAHLPNLTWARFLVNWTNYIYMYIKSTKMNIEILYSWTFSWFVTNIMN